MDYNSFKLEKFEFTDEAIENYDWFSRFSIFLLLPVLTKFVPGMMPPGNFKRKADEALKSRHWYIRYLASFRLTMEILVGIFKGDSEKARVPNLVRFGEAVGFNDPNTRELLLYHQQRLNLHNRLKVILYFSLTLPAFPLLLFISDQLPFIQKTLESSPLTKVWTPLASETLLEVVIVILFTTLGGLILIVIAGTALRFSSVVTGRLFAETLCIETFMYLIVELSRDDVLTRSTRRKGLLIRINHLAQNTLLLSSRYASKDEINKNWLEKHFRHMERYIREREQWVIAPRETTLDDLRQDFYSLLANIYMTGDYGNFKWSSGDKETKPEVSKSSRLQYLLTKLPRFLVGIVLPLVGLGLIVMGRGDLFTETHIDPKIWTLIFITWFLLAIDAILKIGIVAGFTDVAKGLKDLT